MLAFSSSETDARGRGYIRLHAQSVAYVPSLYYFALKMKQNLAISCFLNSLKEIHKTDFIWQLPFLSLTK
jgi:hypothetical protein